MLWNFDILNEMNRLRREMETLFSSFDRSIGATTYPLVNVYDEKDEMIVTAELPGMNKDKVNIIFAEGVLTLSGNVETLASAKNMTAVRQERPSGNFEKKIRIPTKINQEKISASFTNGILTIILPKADEAKPKTIQIEAK